MSHVMALLPSVAMLTGAENYTTWRNAMSDILTLLPAEGFPFSGLDVCENKWLIQLRNVPVRATDGTATVSLTQEQIDENEVIDNARKERERLSRTAIAMINARTTNGLIPIRFENAHNLWKMLKDTYGIAGPSAIYSMFQQTGNFCISGAKEPSAEIAQLEQIYSQLTSNNVEIPPLVQAMTLLGSIPEQWKIASSFLAAKGDVKDVTFHAVRSAILQEYNQRQTANNSQAHRFSGVKQGNQKPAWRPYKGQQQQQRPYNNGPHQNQSQMRPQGQQQQQQRSGPPPKKNRRGKKNHQQVNEVSNRNTAQCIDYTAQDATMFASASVVRDVPAQHVGERSLLTRISHDPRPRPYERLTPGRFGTAKLRAVLQYDERLKNRENLGLIPLTDEQLRRKLLHIELTKELKKDEQEQNLMTAFRSDGETSTIPKGERREAFLRQQEVQDEYRHMNEIFRAHFATGESKQTSEMEMDDAVSKTISEDAPTLFDPETVSLGGSDADQTEMILPFTPEMSPTIQM
ncbi:hypothetical protein Agabi119p4_9812 [Agaricus bisporus var. burnettii]|uniref:Retrotransposon Copia-like N-terminal domain-containing protein n=1 Tax=Agaricus bisporus var. burnettii TaxID=192524 RepID=A0A8H7C4G9_AGABI|nr:hypothetical protein Agabi119p4_9812 [Agaricus bisporus var. burnettii]